MKTLLSTVCALATLATVSDPEPGRERADCGRRGCAWRRQRALDSVFGLGLGLHLRPGVRRQLAVAAIQCPGHHDRDRFHDEHAPRRSPPGTGRESAARRRLPAAFGRAAADLGAQRRLRLGHRREQTVRASRRRARYAKRRGRPDHTDLADAARLHQGGAGRQAPPCARRRCAAPGRAWSRVTTPTMVRLEGVLNDQNLVERIDTWLANPVLGDIKLEAIFSDYKDFGGVKFPTRIVQRSAGYPVLDLTITDVTPNAAGRARRARQHQAAGGAASRRSCRRRSPRVCGSSRAARRASPSNFGDHIVVVDAPENEPRSVAVIEAVRKTIPDKPIRYVINTHSALRSRRRAAHLRRRGRDDRDAGGEHSVLPAGLVQPAHDRARSARAIGPDAGVRRRRRQPDISGRLCARWSSITMPATCTTREC